MPPVSLTSLDRLREWLSTSFEKNGHKKHILTAQRIKQITSLCAYRKNRKAQSNERCSFSRTSSLEPLKNGDLKRRYFHES